jgi:hypothetical protein
MIKRTALSSLAYLLKSFPCVAVLGSRQIGKTTLLKQTWPKAPFYDLEKNSDLDRISRDPEFFLSQMATPVIFDESQILPSLFPALRVAIDAQRNRKGRFLISGSSSPDLLKSITESLAGRVAMFELGGFSLDEAWGKKQSLFYEILDSKRFKELAALKPRYKKNQIVDSLFFGGYPEPFLGKKRDKKFFRLWMENYFSTYINRDIRRLFPSLKIEVFRRFISMLAYSSGDIINASDFARSLDVSQPTVKLYLRIAEGTFLWRNLSSYRKSLRKRITKAPKGYLRDSGLLIHLMGIRSSSELFHHSRVGRIWESFVSEEIIKGFKNKLLDVQPSYYHTPNETEIDLILEGNFGILPIEIKLGVKTDDRRVKGLIRFVEDHKLDLGIVINNSEQVSWLSSKIIQIPAGCL